MEGKLRVVSVLSLTEEQLDRLRAVSPQLEVTQHTSRTPEEMVAQAQNADVLYTFRVEFGPEQAPHLRWIQLASAGADHLLGKPILDCDIILTTTSGIHAVPIAEYVFCSMLAFIRKFPKMFRYQQQHEWPRGRFKLLEGGELRGAVIGIIGYGSIGREIGRLANAFGMTVYALKHSPVKKEHEGYRLPGTGDPDMECVAKVFSPAQLIDMVSQCDMVVVSVPLTAETRGMVTEEALKAMKPSAYFANISRGEIVDEAALIRALQEGWIAGAGLDVFDQEPLPADSPLWDMENAILTPHISGATYKYDDRATDVFAENLRRYLAGEALMNVVDRQRGY